LKWLEGKKTYITAVIMGLTAFGKSMGWITPEAGQTIELYLLPLALGFLRAGVSKSGPN
jgi:hypothetical protein